jgi:hypothetical protein
MREPDHEQFKHAMEKEFMDQYNNSDFILIKQDQVPKGEPIFPGVWAMRRKRKSLTGEVYKWKAHYNLDGSKQEDFYQTYAPVAMWASIHLLLTLSIQHKWSTKQIDFMQAFPQVPISRTQYMEMPKGIIMEGYDSSEYVLELHKNIYGRKDVGRTWNKYLMNKLTDIDFIPSKVDECVFYKGHVMYVLYTDDSTLAGPHEDELESIIQQMKAAGLDIMDEGMVEDFLGVHINRSNGQYHLSQPKLIASILEELHLIGTTNPATTQDTPAASSKLLSRHPDSEPFDQHFHYKCIIGKLNYLEKSSRG